MTKQSQDLKPKPPPPPETELASIPKGERASKLETKSAPQPHQKPAPPKIETLRVQLPLGAFIAFRKSGGLKFSSREIVLYPDGRVSFGGADLSKEVYARATRQLNNAQIFDLRKLLDRAGFFRLQSATGNQPPDSYAYEIVARLGNRSNFVEVFDGGIPDALKSLIDKLSVLMPKEG
jgi:hypothetical protein